MQKLIDVVKMDIEGYEYPSLREMLDSGTFRQVKQMPLEIHTPRRSRNGRDMSSLDYAEIFQVLEDFEKAGFRKFGHKADNDCCRSFFPLTGAAVSGNNTLCCYETFYINTNFSPL